MLEAPLHFPVSEEVPESKLHLELRTALYLILKLAFAKEASVGCDQFVYWNPKNPKRCLAPDAFVRLGQPDDLFSSWKTWERGGPPDVAVEIISETERHSDWGEKLTKYRELGVRELLRYDPEEPAGTRLEIWDLVDGELVARRVVGESAESKVLAGLRWVLAPIGSLSLGLRLARGDGSFLPTEGEAAENELARLRAELEDLKKRG